MYNVFSEVHALAYKSCKKQTHRYYLRKLWVWMIELQLCLLTTKIYNVVISFEQNILNLTAYLLDKTDLIWHFCKRDVNILTFTVTVKAKPDVNPFK